MSLNVELERHVQVHTDPSSIQLCATHLTNVLLKKMQSHDSLWGETAVSNVDIS